MDDKTKLTPEQCEIYIDEAGKIKASCENRQAAEALAKQLEIEPVVISVKPAEPIVES